MINAVILFLSKYGVLGIIAAAFLEAIIFPPPVEVILLPVMLSSPNKAILYGAITVISSMFGGMVGYNLGKAAGKPLLHRFFREDSIKFVEELYEKYGLAAIATSAFTPVPYELYTLSAGAFKMKFSKFMFGALIGRVLRYIPEGVVIQLFGHAISSKTLSSISLFVTGTIIIFIVYILLKKIGAKNRV